MSEERIPAVYSPTTGRIACPLIQAVYGCNQFIPHLFRVADWDTAPNPTMGKFAETRAAWAEIGQMTAAERVALWEAQRDKRMVKIDNSPDNSHRK